MHAHSSNGFCRAGSERLGSGSGWRVSTPLFGPLEVLRQTVRPLVVRRRNR
jgi:hypothetical protein